MKLLLAVIDNSEQLAVSIPKDLLGGAPSKPSKPRDEVERSKNGDSEDGKVSLDQSRKNMISESLWIEA